MPFPSSPRVVFRINPLTEVICQLRFPQVIDIAVSQPLLADFQNEIRLRYPLYRRDEQAVGVPAELASLLNQIPFQVQTTPVHRFASADGAWTISLAPEFVAVQTTDYHDWDAFFVEFDLAKRALERVFKPAFYVRLGLRYKDEIDRSVLDLAGVEWKELLNASFLNLLGSDDVRSEVRQIVTQALVEITDVPGGRAQIRHGLQKHEANRDDTYLIDVDYFTDSRSTDYDLPTALSRFNKRAGDLFRWAITPRLAQALGSADEPAGG